jgi:hypothetical protein
MVFYTENQDSKASGGHVTRANRANILKSPLKSTELTPKHPKSHSKIQIFIYLN